MSKWKNEEVPALTEDFDRIHVIPLNDLIEHEAHEL